jgi:hypothetical protein
VKLIFLIGLAFAFTGCFLSLRCFFLCFVVAMPLTADVVVDVVVVVGVVDVVDVGVVPGGVVPGGVFGGPLGVDPWPMQNTMPLIPAFWPLPPVTGVCRSLSLLVPAGR